MWGTYRGVLEATLSHAEIVADPVHVMKQLNGTITNLLRNLQMHARLGIMQQRASAHRQKR